MTSTNESNQDILKNLRDVIEKKFSKKLSEDEILEKCLNYSKDHLDDLFKENIDMTESTSKKIKKILLNAHEYHLIDLDKSDDELLYGIPKE